METVRTFTAYNVLDGNVNITVELIKCDTQHYEVRETYSTECTCNRSFTITRRYFNYSKAKRDYDKEVHIIIDFA